MEDLNMTTPPPDKIHNWLQLEKIGYNIEQIIALAAQWGADQELKACCALMDDWGLDASDLRAARRSKPLSLKEQALERCNDYIDPDGIIRRALEALPDDRT